MMHTSDRDSTDAPYGLTANDRPIPGGFTGTIPAFLDWLEEHLAYGGVGISEPQPAEFMPQRMVRKVSLVTGGYSDDEALLGRVSRDSLFGMSYWESSHRGGLTVYEVPVASFDSAKKYEWLAAPTDVFERLHRARTIVVQDVAGETVFELPVEHGAVLAFSEPHDAIESAGQLTVSPIPEKDSVWAQLKLANARASGDVDATQDELAD